MSDLIHLIYVSKASPDVSKGAILKLLQDSRDRNRARGLTGMLLYDSGYFMQVLEGSSEMVNHLFAKISSDGRHSDVVRIVAEPIPCRQFGGWTMGFASVSREELATIEGMNDFFTGQTCLAEIGEGRALKILNAFASGRWRLE